MSSHCSNSFILSTICPVCSTCLFHLKVFCALPPGLEGRVQLLCNVPDLLGLSVNTAVVGKHTYSRHTTLFSFIHFYVEIITVLWRWGWVADSPGNSPQWGKEDPLSQVALVGPKAVDKRVQFISSAQFKNVTFENIKSNKDYSMTSPWFAV